jgi:hypothetical protein
MKLQSVTLWAAACFCWCGCQSARDVSLTGRLWQERDYVVPAPSPHLALLRTAQGILVQYDASFERNGDLRRQAYYLEPNVQRIAAGQKPVFTEASKAGALNLISIFSQPPTNGPQPELYAVCTSNQCQFTVYRPGEAFGPCDLPVYKDQQETATQLALTPLAVTGDASIVAAIAGYLWVECVRGGSVTIPGPWPANH